MSLRSTFVLMWICLAVVGFAFYDYAYRKPARETAKEKESRLFSLDGKKLEKIRFHKPGLELELVCADQGGCAMDNSANWKMTSPLQEDADPSTVGNFTSSALNLDFVEELDFETDPDPKEFGFGDGAIRADLIVKGDPKPVSFEVGGAAAVGPNRYLRLSSKPKQLYLVPAHFVRYFEGELFAWRGKRLFAKMDSENVTSLSWKGKSALSFQREEGRWKSVSPRVVRADSILLEGLVSTIVYLQAIAVPEAGVKPGPQFLDLDFTVGNDKHRVLLHKHAKDPARLLARSDKEERWLEVDAAAFQRFQKPFDEYREHRMLPDRIHNVTDEVSFSFPRQKKQVIFKKEKEGWTQTGGDKMEDALSVPRLQKFLDSTGLGQAKAFFGPGSQSARALQAGVPDVEVELKNKGELQGKIRFLVLDRKSALTDGLEAGEARAFGDDVLPYLPVRMEDLYLSHNKQVVTTEEEPDGHDHSHGSDPHRH